MRSIFSLVVSTLLFSGCALFKENKGPPPTFAPREQIYHYNFDKVWRATQLALQAYPMKINNMDLGVLETDYVKGYNVWTPPHKPNARSGGMSYRLIVHVVKGKTDGDSAVKVTLMKELELRRDFFSEPQQLPSDGLEEKSLLYRIERELQIERALERLQNRKNSKAY